MKILALALLISLCVAYEDWSLTWTANSTQAYGGYGDSTGSCTFTGKWTQADMTLEGEISCTGLKGNVTAVHLHDVTKSYSVTYNTGNPLADIGVTVPADPTVFPYSYKATLTKTDSIDAICNDQTYWNVHTTYDSYGEVRANIVNMIAICNIKGYTPDGSLQTYGAEEPDTGVEVQSFCSTGYGEALVGTGGAVFQVCWDQPSSTLTFSGVTFGLTSEVYGIYIYYPDDTSYFIYLSSYSFPYDCPFSFRYTGVTDWQLAKIASKNAYVVIETYDNTNGEVQVDIDPSTDFPVSKATCRPYTEPLPTTPLTCYYGTDDYKYEYECGSADQFCAIYASAGYETKTCSTWSYCYDCDCGADVETDIPTYGYACCDTSYCNALSLDLLNCIDDAGSAISGGLLVTLFVALISIWFN
jgi:hypothetical protein